MKSTRYLELKADLLVDGIRATPQALEGLGSQYKEQNHGLFGWDFEDHTGLLLPDDFALEDGTIVQFRQNRRSNYVVDRVKDKLALSDGREVLSEVRWLPRPAYYNQKTTSGNEMIKIGQIGGQDCLFFCYQNFCRHFARNEQCLFCNLVATSRTYDSVLRKKEAEDIGEVARAAFSEGTVKHVLLTGGCFDHQKEINVLTEILSSIGRHTGLTRILGVAHPSPARNIEELKKYYDTGIQALAFSMEIWDEKLYQGICPGKSQMVSHQEFLDSIRLAVKIFGAGNVYAVFVCGIEPRVTFLDGVRAITALGANIVPFVWSPNPGSKFEGHRAPFGRWYVETMLAAAEIVYDSKVPSGTENHCFKCDGNSLLHDALRLKVLNNGLARFFYPPGLALLQRQAQVFDQIQAVFYSHR